MAKTRKAPDASQSSRKRFERLQGAVSWSREQLEPFRSKRLEFIKEYVGANYSDDGSEDHNPVNFIELAINIFSRFLVSQSPRVVIGTKYRNLKPTAMNLELATNHLLEEIAFEESMRRMVIDALFSIGIMKLGIAYGGNVEIQGYRHDIGQPFADVVDLDDFVVDMNSKTLEQVAFIGNRYRLPLEWVKDSDMYDKSVSKDLTPTIKKDHNEEGDARVETISRGYVGAAEEDEYQDYVELWDLWLPMEKELATFASDDEDSIDSRPLRVVPWEGPETGPFHVLGFGTVPGQIMPAAPCMYWYDLHVLYQELFNKLGRQAVRQKTILGVNGDGDDGVRITESNDGEGIALQFPDRCKEYSFGGPSNENFAFILQIRDLFTYMAGNLDALGGLSPQSETLGQDRILEANASKRVTDMQATVVKVTTRIIRDLDWYLWTDPLIDIPLTKRVQGTNLQIETRWSAEQAEGDFLDYNFSIEPYSMQHSSPSQKLQGVMQVLQQVILPMMPQLQERGITVNAEGLLRTIGKYANLHELEDILTFGAPLNPEGPVGQQERPAKSPVSTRTYERVNRPGATRGGKDQALMSSLLGARPQKSEMAAVARPVG